MKVTFPPALKKYLPYVPIGAILLWLIYLLLPKSLFHSLNCTLETLPTNYQASNGLFVDNQVIVIGQGAEVDKAVASLNLNLIEGCDLSYLDTRKIPDSILTEDQQKSLVFRLYEMPVGDDPTKDQTEEIINQIETYAPDDYVYADPNYLVSLSDTDLGSCADPFSGGGSPFSGGGSPYDGPGIPNKDPEISERAFEQIMQEQFTSQWAFGDQGIILPPLPGVSGRGVRVGIFDTSPFRKAHPFIWRVSIAQPSPLWLTTRDTFGSESIVSNHGLFVAGLIHEVAPKSRIQLIRVLNANGCGYLDTIIIALQDYISQMSAWNRDLNKVVINLSLGVQVSDNEDLETLQKTIDYANSLGAIFVAASGNNSYPTIEDPEKEVQEMQYPAFFDNVIGVAATNMDGERSCYSNKGNVAAPGGDGGLGISGEPCVSRASTWNQYYALDNVPSDDIPPQCTNMAECPYGLISLSRTDDGNQSYMYWAGTSFSAPLVSGLAALVYEEVESDPNLVRCIIENGATPVFLSGTTDEQDESLGAGIIKVHESLNINIDNVECPPR